MSSDPTKKTSRSFHCRDALWETFERMSRELECSTDYLINEAMKAYAEQRGVTLPVPPPASSHAPVIAPSGLPPLPSRPAPLPPGRALSLAPGGGEGGRGHGGGGETQAAGRCAWA